MIDRFFSYIKPMEIMVYIKDRYRKTCLSCLMNLLLYNKVVSVDKKGVSTEEKGSYMKLGAKNLKDKA